MNVLVLGSKGQLGRCLYDQFKNEDHEVTYTSRDQIDVGNFEDTKAKILDTSPDVIINATAFTHVDKAEQDEQIANHINHLAVANISEVCNQINCWFVHISTDYVFDGNSSTPYKEDDQTNPQSTYGQTKLWGELAIKASGCKHIIIRTAWVFSEYGNNFFKTMLRLGADHDELNIVGDQIGCPTYAQDIASSITKILSKLHSQNYNGTYHYCGDQPCSWHSFANIIFEQASVKNMKVPSTINSIDTINYKTLAKRPAFSVLDCSKIKNDFGLDVSNWKKGIEQALIKLKKE